MGLITTVEKFLREKQEHKTELDKVLKSLQDSSGNELKTYHVYYPLRNSVIKKLRRMGYIIPDTIKPANEKEVHHYIMWY